MTSKVRLPEIPSASIFFGRDFSDFEEWWLFLLSHTFPPTQIFFPSPPSGTGI